MNQSKSVLGNSFSYLPLRIALYEGYWKMSQKVKAAKSQELYKQKLELMTYRDDFQTEISFFRKRFDIPVSGFPNFKTCKEWAQKLTVFSEPKRSAKEDPLRAYTKLQQGTLLESEYEKALAQILSVFEIDERWSEAVEYHLLFNKMDTHEVLPKSVVVRFVADAKTNKPTLCLQITADAEYRDVLEWWGIIQKFQAILRSLKDVDYSKNSSEIAKAVSEIDPVPYVAVQEKKKDRKRFPYAIEKCRRAYLLRQEGKSYNEIGSKIGCAQNEVGTYISRFKEMVSKNRLD